MNNSDSPQVLSRIAEEAYLFAYPLVLMEATRQSQTSLPAGAGLGSGPANRFSHARAFPPGDFRTVVRPNFDTLYSTLWFDLREGPVLITVPDAGDRYYMLPFLDMWTDVFAVVGTRTTGTGSGTYGLVGPGWQGALPAGVTRIDAPTPIGWVIGRIRTDGTDDYPAVHRFQDELRATPLAASGVSPDEQNDGPATGVGEPASSADDPLDLVSGLSGVELLARAADLMRVHPPHLIDQPMIARLRRLGVVAGEGLDAQALDPQLRDLIDGAARSAAARMTSYQARIGTIVGGWMSPISAMGVYGTDYLRRAVVAKVGLGANLVEDAVYPLLLRDADGAVPHGDTDYVLHFEADSLPPADAFWSVTMYDAEGFTVPNALDRYAIGDRDPLRYNADGSLDLLLQRGDPGDDRRSNWLPSPAGPLGVTMRLYGPRAEVLDGRWTPPPLHRASAS